MSEFVVRAQERAEFGKNVNRRLRGRGLIPGVVYGHNFDTAHVAVDPLEIVQILHSESGHNTIFKIRFAKKSADVLIKHLQLDPLRGTLIHADFQTVAMDETMVFQVPVETKGTAVGVKAHGGVLDQVIREVEVECLPGDVPDSLDLDVTDLEIGDAVRVADLVVDETKLKILSDPEQLLIHVVPPRVEETVEVVEEEVAEPELIRKVKEAEEEAERAESLSED